MFYGDPHREDLCKANSAVSSGQDAIAKASADVQQKPGPLRNGKQLRELVQAPVAQRELERVLAGRKFYPITKEC